MLPFHVILTFRVPLILLVGDEYAAEGFDKFIDALWVARSGMGKKANLESLEPLGLGWDRFLLALGLTDVFAFDWDEIVLSWLQLSSSPSGSPTSPPSAWTGYPGKDG